LSPFIGNVTEGAFRSAMLHAGPLSIVTWHKVMKELRKTDPERAAALEHALIGQGRVTMEGSQRFMNSDQFSPDSPGMRAAVRAAEAMRGTKIGGMASGSWRLWTHFMLEMMNNRLAERPVQKMQAGKAIRDSGLLGIDSMLGLGEKSIKQAVEGLRETKEQVALANRLRDSYGAYRAFTPWQKKTVATYTPFLAWWLNSVRFVSTVLPRDHPTALALTAQAMQVVDDVDRQKARSGWLKGTLVAGGTQWQLSRNTPFGAFTDPAKQAAGLFLPQIAPVVAAMLYGIDWKGKPLRNEDGSPYTPQQILQYSAGQIASSSVPAWAVLTRGKKYVEEPGVLLNAIRVRDSKESKSESAKPRPKYRKPSPPVRQAAPQSDDEFWSQLEQGGTTEQSDDEFWSQIATP
jgi:hypothetical protein